jgi:hypothetical protein
MAKASWLWKWLENENPGSGYVCDMKIYMISREHVVDKFDHKKI